MHKFLMWFFPDLADTMYNTTTLQKENLTVEKVILREFNFEFKDQKYRLRYNLFPKKRQESFEIKLNKNKFKSLSTQAYFQVVPP